MFEQRPYAILSGFLLPTSSGLCYYSATSMVIEGVGWKDQLSEHQQLQWKEWFNKATAVEQIKLCINAFESSLILHPQ